ncbi:hypothetical protein L6452_43393 [Arctium lappa]|uniref:Uncharacterized protein n=1 Tax=Arctium lappa TaxID=4217 RepID=A0ACB8XE13_ARCLA|nr:hypothetical protein L6452_43393 [Arctium lappa]
MADQVSKENHKQVGLHGNGASFSNGPNSSGGPFVFGNLESRPQAMHPNGGVGSHSKPTSNEGLPSILGKPPSSPMPEGQGQPRSFGRWKATIEEPEVQIEGSTSNRVHAGAKEESPPPVVIPPSSIPPKGSNQSLSQPLSKPKSPKPLTQTKTKANSPSSNRFAILGDPSLTKDPGSSSFSSPIHVACSEPMDTAVEQDDLFDEEDVIEVDSDDGATARFLTRDPLPSQVDLVPTPEPERMDSTPSFVSQ